MRWIMDRYTLQDAQEHLQQLMVDAQKGKTVLIVSDNDLAVRLVPVEIPAKPRKAGSAHGLIQIAPDFDAPLADFDEYMA